MLAPAVDGLSADGKITRAVMKAFKLREKGGWATLEAPAGAPLFEPETLRGQWICIPTALLADDSGTVYRFQLIGCRIKEAPDSEAIAIVSDYYETSAHGVLCAVTEDREVLIPYVEQYIELKLEERTIIVRQFRDFFI